MQENKKFEAHKLLDLKNLPFKQAIDQYNKMKFVSSYGAFYGRIPALADLTDTTALKTKKFSNLPCCSILKQDAKNYLDSWQSLEKEQEYVAMAISTLRSLNTYIK